MKRIVISEFMDAPAVAALRGRFEVDYRPKLVDDAAALASALAEAHAWIVRNRTQVRGGLLAAAARLSVVGRLGVGLDNIDVPACEARGIRVIPATGANAQAVAEYVVAAALVLLRGAYHASAEVAAGRWPRAALSEGREAAGQSMGIVGFGSIGRATAAKAAALGMRILAHDPRVPAGDPAWAEARAERLELDALLARSDVVSLHVPLIPATRGLIGAERLARMKPGAILVNTARGGIVDEAAVAAALREGRLGGAALDVFDAEPLAAGSPLAGAPRLILTPHIAGVTVESNERVSSMIASRVAEALGTG
ncbi:MAG TPA: hydroxyacid dehydrogenase [Usitatibacter sp.]|nr:hydroxyacid dehydrogenase [Usitatibacter sp.]